MGKATVAIVLSNYNHGRYLPESLGGICAQTRPADEIIVIDDGSTDDSVEVIESFMRREPRLRLLKNERNLGLQESIARALPQVTSDYLAWAASDDRLLPGFLEKSLAVLERHPSAGLCFSETTELKGDTGEMERFAIEPSVRHIFDLSDLPEYMSPAEVMRRMEWAYLPIASNTAVIRRDALLAIGGYPRQLEWHSDIFASMVVALRHGACVVPETLALIRAKAGSYSQGGMKDPMRQRAVLTAMLDILARPDYRDIRRAFRRCPSNFSPWHAPMLKLQLSRLRDWDLFVPYLVWKISEYKRGHQLGWPRTVWELGLRLLRSVRWRAKALMRLESLVAERDSAQRQIEAISADRDRLAGLAGMLEAERSEFSAERQHLKARLDAVTAIRNELEVCLNSVTLELDRLRGELQAGGEEREALLGQLQAVSAGREELREQLRAGEAEREALRGELEAAGRERDGAMLEGAEGDGLKERLEAVIAEREALRGELEVAARERDESRAMLEAAARQRDEQKAQAVVLEAELDRMKGDLQQIHGDYVSAKSIAEEYKGALEKTRLLPMLITTMPKSGTYYLSRLFGEGLFIETRIVSHQYFPYDVIRQPELRALSRGNCISQDHFGASKINLTHIGKHVDRMIVHVRDPRQATLSYVHFLDTPQFRRNEEETLLFIYPPLPDGYYRLDFGAKLDWAIANWLPLLVEWTQEWVEAANSLSRPKIKFTRYEDLVADRDAFVRDVLDFFGIPLERFIPPQIVGDEEIHFRKGEVDEWRGVFTAAQAAAATAKIPKKLAARFGWPVGRRE